MTAAVSLMYLLHFLPLSEVRTVLEMKIVSRRVNIEFEASSKSSKDNFSLHLRTLSSQRRPPLLISPLLPVATLRCNLSRHPSRTTLSLSLSLSLSLWPARRPKKKGWIHFLLFLCVHACNVILALHNFPRRRGKKSQYGWT